MSVATRAWIYRVLLLAVIAYAILTQPDTLQDWIPVLVGLAGNGLATGYTKVG